MKMMTATGGSIASTVVAMIRFQSACASAAVSSLVMPITIVSMPGLLVTSSGQRYWFQP